jgi:acyl-CoA thioester hydrolase
MSSLTTTKKLLESKIKIRFHDCDPFNHLNNSKYIDYIIAARGDQLLENYQFDIYKLAQEEKLGWVAAQTQIAYLFPAFVMEEVWIQTKLIAFSENSLLMEGLMLDGDKTTVKAVMWTKLVHFNLRTQKSHRHNENLMAFFEQIVNPLPAPISFDERVIQLKSIK